MTSIHDLKLASETLEALNFLLQNTVDLENAISSIDLTELKNISRDGGQLKEHIEKLVVEIQNDKSFIEEIKRDIETKADATKEKIAEFDNTASTLNAKYAELAELQARLKGFEKDIKGLLSSGLINDTTESANQTFSSKKITELLNRVKSVIDEKFVTLSKSGITAWNTTLEYTIDAVTVFNGKLYLAKRRNTGKKPSENQDEWEAIAGEKWSEKTFLKQTDKIDAYSKAESDKRFMQNYDLDTQNLNDFLICGSFRQGAIRNARLDLNYPVAAYGTLEVFPTGQRYVVYETNETYQRTLVSAQNKTWGAWEKVAAPIEKLPFLGVNQTRRDVTDQRRVGEIYTNNTGRAIFVAIQVHILPSSGSALEAFLEVGGVAVSSARHGSTAGFLDYALTAIILPNEQYTLRLGGSAKILKWFELR